jgi:predicted  nucleic acid-binding Zn-ribbon protein
MDGNKVGLTSALVREKLGDKMGAAVERLEAQAEEARELRLQVESLRGNAEQLSAKVETLSEAVRALSAAADEKLGAGVDAGRAQG